MNANLKTATAKALIVLVPTYTVAFVTEMMVYVVPMLAACGFFASYVEIGTANITRRHDDTDEHDENESLEDIDQAIDYNSNDDG